MQWNRKGPFSDPGAHSNLVDVHMNIIYAHMK